ncbi:BlaI/MecI/CopY family transcriptional regulator [Oscillibacter sp. MSJ-2]|uniref:BlaI/MecI/CopY family transcriptional regulator n=1 Tax=Dysosmobacter acutus TaxID=2841504 RepID=A0ABS6FAL8_9FIRM|nr:BlaI/MecI/CopY family transcriptional regulator [Dysosmobacter acutus]MBU5627332.1 BlaI/MecI/CopY family transcriptional regulator [Dysosmobacter acutus]
MKINLSDGEWKVMNRLWEQSPRTITELVGALREETGWSKHTVITMLGRMESKGAVHYAEGARAKQYYPSIRREDAILTETESFLHKVGGFGSLVNAMVSGNALTEQDLAELSELLRQSKEDSL